jgi:hypothetical protein
MLRNNTSQWHIPTVIYALRVKVHSILKKTPYELLYGVPPPTSDSLAALGRGLTVQSFSARTEAHQNLGEHQLYLREHLLGNGRAFVFQPKDLVMLKRLRPKHSKFEPTWYGPYSVHSRLGLFTYRLSDIVTGEVLESTVSADRLKPYRLRKGVMLRQDVDPQLLSNRE